MTRASPDHHECHKVLKWVLGEYFVPLLALVVKLTILVAGTMVVLLNSAPLRRLRIEPARSCTLLRVGDSSLK